MSYVALSRKSKIISENPLQDLKKGVEFTFLIQTTPFEVTEKRAVLGVEFNF